MEDITQAIWDLLQKAYATTADMWANHPATMIVLLFVFAMMILWTEARSDDQ